jgi:endonuclease YncB( thermonuclease family)
MALFYPTDKYGRLMCTFYDEKGEDINQWMVKQGYAVEYMGKTKKKFQPSSPAPAPAPEPTLSAPSRCILDA